MGPVLAGGVDIGLGLHDAAHFVRGGGDALFDRAPGQHRLGLAGAHRFCVDAGQHQARFFDAVVLQRNGCGDADQGEIAVATGEFKPRLARPGAQGRQQDVREDFVRLEGGGQVADEEVLGSDLAPTLGPTTSDSAPRHTTTAGNSAAGSACARLPPSVPRERIAG